MNMGGEKRELGGGIDRLLRGVGIGKMGMEEKVDDWGRCGCGYAGVWWLVVVVMSGGWYGMG